MTHALKSTRALQPKSRGDEIRWKIEANRKRRLAIAEAMKAEAGVVSHEINKEGEGGLARLDTGVILSPEGRNMRQLYIVAHECGHVFLHRDAEGLSLPTHVKEMEAEMYANQAFMAHGMMMPPEITAWGRKYVRAWIEIDTQIGLPIDQAARAYAAGERSPFDPLRRVPASWLAHPKIPRPLPVAQVVPTATAPPEMRMEPCPPRRIPRWVNRLWSDLRDWSRFVGRHALYGMGVSNLTFSLMHRVPLIPEITVMDPISMIHRPLRPSTLALGLPGRSSRLCCARCGAEAQIAQERWRTCLRGELERALNRI